MLPRKRPRDGSSTIPIALESKDGKIDTNKRTMVIRETSSTDRMSDEIKASAVGNKKSRSRSTCKDPESILLHALEEDIANDLDVVFQCENVRSDTVQRTRQVKVLLQVPEDEDYDASE